MKRGIGRLVLAVTVSVLFPACDGPAADNSSLPPKFSKLLPLHAKLLPPRPGDWLASHPEPGQTYVQFVKGGPNRADHRRNVIYVQPLGDASPPQRKVIDAASAYLGVFFGLKVKQREPLPFDVVPEKARRTHPTWGVPQILTTYVLEEVLAPRLPDDAVASIAFTTSDLWPGEGWNFVFGQASLKDRVGVWSIHRFGDPAADEATRLLCLQRTLKLASHETGHMFTLWHCTFYDCNMCGSNNLSEADRQPMWLCPHCHAKLCYATGVAPETRLAALIRFCQQYQLKKETDFFRRELEVLRK